MEENSKINIQEKEVVSETPLPASIKVLKAGQYVEGIGRRKSATARVRVFASKKETVEIVVNGKSYRVYFSLLNLQKLVDAPLRKLRVFNGYEVSVITSGGGIKGQAEAVRLGLARAISKLSNDWLVKMKKVGYMTRDSRRVERKKYGLKKARKGPQWSKR